MPFDIQPLHIALVAVIVIGVFYYLNSRRTREENKRADDIRKKLNEPGGEIGAQTVDKPMDDEEEAQTLSEADQRDPADIDDVQIEDDVPETVVVPDPVVQADEYTPDAAASRSAAVDPAVEMLVNIVPREEGKFERAAFERLCTTFLNEPLWQGRGAVHAFDTVSGLWYTDHGRVTECSQLYLSLPIATRGWKIDETVASRFLTLADRFAIELKGEADAPDMGSVMKSAELIEKLIAAYDIHLSVKLVSPEDITEERFAEALTACGFEEKDGTFAKYVAGCDEPAFTAQRSKTLGNEAELSMYVPLIPAADDPLSKFFEIANDLCCRLEAVMTDAAGRPIGTLEAGKIGRELKVRQQNMANHGLAAGSRRAALLFSSR